MADTVVGRRLDQLRIFLIRRSRQTIALQWLDDTGQPTALAPTASVTLEIDQDGGSPIELSGVTDATQTTWDLTAAQTDLTAATYTGRVVISDGDPAGQLVALGALISLQ